ncbi:MAG: sugar nucleotide-binding protein [Nitrospira sp.]|nr:sugar nucleotide-binding protein [Nitrospira sp.]
MRHIAITGISGKVGDALRRYGSPSSTLTGLVHNNLPVTEGLAEVVREVDCTDRAKVRDLVRGLARNKVRTIINCAGETDLDGVEGQRYAAEPTTLSAYQNNTRIAEVVADACAEVAAEGVEILLLHLSSESVFGDNVHGKKYTEEDELKVPRDPTGAVNYADTVMMPTFYGLTKVLGEQKVLERYREGSVIVRMHGVQGPLGGFFKRTCSELQLGQPFTRVDDMYVAHLTDATIAEAIFAIEEAMHDPERRTRGRYHLSARNPLTPYDISLRFADRLGKPRSLITPILLNELIEAGRKSGKPLAPRPYYTILDVAKFERDFYRLPTAEAAIDEYVELYGHLFST